ncbi:hypothetical protein OIV83_002576 [Microbotryomycetes sp. JL201]|nr:hypothetical protein OIV83_002576 [Microbotryomycetes sp. JL201]
MPAPLPPARRYTTRSHSSSSSSPVTAHHYSYDGSDVFAEEPDADGGTPPAPGPAPPQPHPRRATRRRRRPRSGTNDSGQQSENELSGEGAGDDDGDNQDATSVDHSVLSGVSTRLEDEDSMYSAEPEEVEQRAWELIRLTGPRTSKDASKVTVDDIPHRVIAATACLSSADVATSKQQLHDEAVTFLRQCVSQLDETDWQYPTPKVFSDSHSVQRSRKSTAVVQGLEDLADHDDELAAAQGSWILDDQQLPTTSDLRRMLLGDGHEVTDQVALDLARAGPGFDFQTDGDSDNHTIVEMEDPSGSTLDFQDQAHDMAY